MLTYEENVRAVLETHFSGFKDEIIDSTVNNIMRIKTQKAPNDIDIQKYRVCCPMCDLSKCKKDSEECEATIWAKKKKDEEIENLENSMLSLGYDLNKMAWDMSCE